VSAEPAAAAAAVEEDVEASIAAQSVEFMTKLNQFSAMAASLKSEFRTLEKKYARLLKAALKTNSKKKKRAGNRAPSGFVKPTKISDELAKFLEKPTGTEMARTDVTREINKYIRSHNLQDVGNGRKINPDQKLKTLLKLKTTDELTYFNLQKYMSPHFYKAEKAIVSADVTTSA
jgi:upstream activation factor subunit UAF30